MVAPVAKDPVHERLLAIVKSLPGTEEAWPWGSIHCKVAGKIFVGWGRHDDGVMSLGFKTDKELQGMLITSDPRFTMAAYVGKHGWVDMKLGAKPNSKVYSGTKGQLIEQWIYHEICVRQNYAVKNRIRAVAPLINPQVRRAQPS